MKRLLLVVAMMGLAACETTSFGTGISIGSDGTKVTNTVTGTSGNTSVGVSVGL
ncbi:MAG: hypothetical protein AAFX45_03505 [Pseudomonadota bacterium]